MKFSFYSCRYKGEDSGSGGGCVGFCPQPAFDLSAQAEGGSTPAPRPNPYDYGYIIQMLRHRYPVSRKKK